MTTEHKSYIGAYVPRTEAPDKVRGAFPYLADSPWPDCLHAVVLFSPIAHGRVKSFDATQALAIPGVMVLGPDDAPKALYNSGEWFPGQNDFPDERVLTSHVRHVGDRVALVLAGSPAEARRARELLRVEYEELPALIDLREAETRAAELHDDGHASFPGRIAFGDVDEAFASAARVVTTRVRTPKIHHAAMETHAVLAVPRPGGILEVHSPCQIMFGVQHAVAVVTGLPLSRIRVIKVPMGGTFGGKQEVVFEPLCAWAALQIGRPVLLDTDRTETIVSTRTRAATDATVSTALDDQGRILGRRFDVTIDAGAYLTGSKKVLMAMGKKTSRLYRIGAMEYTGRAVRTSTTPGGACRGYGSPQIHSITELHTDLLCRQLGYDPVEFRLKNLVTSADSDPSGASPLGDVHVIECLQRGVKLFDWPHRAQPIVRGRFRTAAGFACATHGNGYAGTIYHDFIGLSLRILEDGSAVLRTGLHEMGTGTLGCMAQIVAEVTRIPPDRITVTEGDTFFSHYDIGCQASRVIYVCGECARLVALKALRAVETEGEKLLGVPVRMVDGGLLTGDEPMDLGELIRRLVRERGVTIDVQQDYRPEKGPASYGVHFAQVTVDTLTGLTRVDDFLAVHDIGRAISRSFVEGQINGGVQMGIGMALTEELTFDERGHPSATNFDKYHMVNAPDMPPVRIELIEGIEPGGPFGGKSIGEICTAPTAAAVANAVNRALGTSMTRLPFTPARIVAALEAQKLHA